MNDNNQYKSVIEISFVTFEHDFYLTKCKKTNII